VKAHHKRYGGKAIASHMGGQLDKLGGDVQSNDMSEITRLVNLDLALRL